MLARSRMLSVGFLAIVMASGIARAQTSTSTVVDGASMFSANAIREATAEMAKIDRLHGVPVTVETVESLRGLGIDEVAIRKAEQLGHKGIYVLIAKRDHKAEVLASPRALLEELGKNRLNEIRDAFLAEFRKDKVDDGLIKGVQEVEKVLAAVHPVSTRRVEGGGFLPSPSSLETGSSPLVVRQQVRLTLAGARKAIAGAEAKAAKEGWKMNIAAVDDGGHLLAFARMDGARPASVATATTKAISAATFRQATGPLGATASPDVLQNLSLENAAAATGGKITTLLGGVPIVVDGQVIGALGVGGGTGAQDAEVAKAGVAAFLDGLQAKPEETQAKPKEGEKDSKPKEIEKDSKPKDANAPASTTKPAEGDTSPK